ncbi:hypothetical protein HMPREF9310_02120 [Staphylococcus simulans ACS-120-V-Sch1]|uniref:hypothetical protein n=1 Tax=Staphylococcus simulans TaxID=1286 RepID=UPI00029952AC|nr:hypothetical protein [Staphylococcus simulans]EKS24293.1 hypothetical protein HMPREF9310_02120 [Staphylococcus simulans ACS-120-V-Sch1]
MDKSSVFIAKIKFARDPNSQVKARQFIVIMKNNEHVFFLETEKTLNKAKFNVNNRAETERYYHILTQIENNKNGFKMPTAINCREVFKCDYFPELLKLKNREVTLELIQTVIDKVNHVRSHELNYPDVYISKEQLSLHNPKLAI